MHAGHCQCSHTLDGSHCHQARTTACLGVRPRPPPKPLITAHKFYTCTILPIYCNSAHVKLYRCCKISTSCASRGLANLAKCCSCMVRKWTNQVNNQTHLTHKQCQAHPNIVHKSFKFCTLHGTGAATETRFACHINLQACWHSDTLQAAPAGPAAVNGPAAFPGPSHLGCHMPAVHCQCRQCLACLHVKHQVTALYQIPDHTVRMQQRLYMVLTLATQKIRAQPVCNFTCQNMALSKHKLQMPSPSFRREPISAGKRCITAERRCC